MNQKIQLIEGAVYKLKVGLYAQKYGGKHEFGTLGIFKAGNHVFYDQEKDGWHIFGAFEPSVGYYVSIPDYIIDEQVELVDKDNLVPLKNK